MTLEFCAMSEAEATATPDGSDDWPAKATQSLVGYVDTVRSATTGKALVASRAIVYFLAIALIGFVVFVLVLVLLVRLLVSITALLPFIDSGEVWLAYLITGSLFLFSGMFAWTKKDA
jgi:hypothetical protein